MIEGQGKKLKPTVVFQFREILKFYQAQNCASQHQGILKELNNLFEIFDTKKN